jgi:hypothetical protein
MRLAAHGRRIHVGHARLNLVDELEDLVRVVGKWRSSVHIERIGTSTALSKSFTRITLSTGPKSHPARWRCQPYMIKHGRRDEPPLSYFGPFNRSPPQSSSLHSSRFRYNAERIHLRVVSRWTHFDRAWDHRPPRILSASTSIDTADQRLFSLHATRKLRRARRSDAPKSVDSSQGAIRIGKNHDDSSAHSHWRFLS